MIIFNLSPIFSARGIKNGYTFLKKLGIGHMASHHLKNGTVRSVRLDHIEKICLALHCTPNDLLQWKSEDHTVSTSHPLHTLRREEDQLDVLAEMKNLPLDKLDELKKKLAEWKEE